MTLDENKQNSPLKFCDNSKGEHTSCLSSACVPDRDQVFRDANSRTSVDNCNPCIIHDANFDEGRCYLNLAIYDRQYARYGKLALIMPDL